MPAKSKPILVMLCVMFVAGCGGSKYRTSAPGGKQFPAPALLKDVPEMETPKILPQTYYAAAQLFESQGLISKAITQYRKAVAVNHNYVAAYNRLGILLGRTGAHAEAIRMFERAIQLKPEYAALHNNLGFEYAMREMWPEAERALLRALELKPDFDRARINLGLVLCRAGRFDEGLTHFLAVLPEPDAYYTRGLMLHGQGRYEDAAHAFAHVLRLSPRFAAAREQLDIIQPKLEEIRAERERQATEFRSADAGKPAQPSAKGTLRSQEHGFSWDDAAHGKKPHKLRDAMRRALALSKLTSNRFSRSSQDQLSPSEQAAFKGKRPATMASSVVTRKHGLANHARRLSRRSGSLMHRRQKIHSTAPRKLIIHRMHRPSPREQGVFKEKEPATMASSVITRKLGLANHAWRLSPRGSFSTRQCQKIYRTAPRMQRIRAARRPLHWSTRLKQLSEELAAARKSITALEAKLFDAARGHASPAGAPADDHRPPAGAPADDHRPPAGSPVPRTESPERGTGPCHWFE